MEMKLMVWAWLKVRSFISLMSAPATESFRVSQYLHVAIAKLRSVESRYLQKPSRFR